MRFEVLDTLSIPGDPAKPNEDAVLAEPVGAVVLDGATPVNEPLLPGKSDAAWLATFGARRLISHIKNGDAPRAALRHALSDAEFSFAGLRRRAPEHAYEIPCASMMFVVPNAVGMDALWYGDCAALVLMPDGTFKLLGEAMEKRVTESDSARRWAKEMGVPPAGALSRAEFLPRFRQGRAKVNTRGGDWLFAPNAAVSEHAARARLAAAAGTVVLACSDGLLVLACNYGAYDAKGLLAAAMTKGLAALGQELRAIEEADPEGRQLPRFKKSDDATAVLLKLV
jgi:hypothetical protein